MHDECGKNVEWQGKEELGNANEKTKQKSVLRLLDCECVPSEVCGEAARDKEGGRIIRANLRGENVAVKCRTAIIEAEENQSKCGDDA